MINQHCPLVLSNLYNYDISMCYFNILKSVGWDVSDVDYKDKEKRNIQLGIIQKDNSKLGKYLVNCTDNIIDNYLIENKIIDEELIVRQKDGIIVTKILNKKNISIPISLKSVIIKLIINLNRKSFVALNSDGSVDVKGLSNKPYDTTFYKLFLNLDFTSKRIIVNSIENMRQSFLNSDNVKWFSIQNENVFLVPIKNHDMLKLNLSTLSMVDINDVDKVYIWNTYLWPFCRSIILTYV